MQAFSIFKAKWCPCPQLGIATHHLTPAGVARQRRVTPFVHRFGSFSRYFTWKRLEAPVPHGRLQFVLRLRRLAPFFERTAFPSTERPLHDQVIPSHCLGASAEDRRQPRSWFDSPCLSFSSQNSAKPVQLKSSSCRSKQPTLLLPDQRNDPSLLRAWQLYVSAFGGPIPHR